MSSQRLVGIFVLLLTPLIQLTQLWPAYADPPAVTLPSLEDVCEALLQFMLIDGSFRADLGSLREQSELMASRLRAEAEELRLRAAPRESEILACTRHAADLRSAVDEGLGDPAALFSSEAVRILISRFNEAVGEQTRCSRLLGLPEPDKVDPPAYFSFGDPVMQRPLLAHVCHVASEGLVVCASFTVFASNRDDSRPEITLQASRFDLFGCHLPLPDDSTLARAWLRHPGDPATDACLDLLAEAPDGAAADRGTRPPAESATPRTSIAVPSTAGAAI